ncbi:hypothetical protein HDU85_007061 [Gaertneriomyces sp. JEL0708]|nr:hypothetical protein HDU85_007061 [Gaertneriomyces sp. JEL0708]
MLRAETTLEPVIGEVLMRLGLVELLSLTAARATDYQRLQTWLVITVMGMISRNYGGPCSTHTDRELDEVASKLFAIVCVEIHFSYSDNGALTCMPRYQVAQYLMLHGTNLHYKHTVLQALLTTLRNLHVRFEEALDDVKHVLEEVIALMRHLLDTQSEDKVQLAILKCMATYVPWSDRENVDTLHSLFRVMNADNSPQVIKAALDIITSNYRGTHVLSAYALELKDVLLKLLRGSRWEVRDSVLEFTQQGILDGTGAGVSIAACVDLYCEDDEPWVRAAALRATAAVGSCSSTRMEEVIRKGLKDECALVRRVAVEILSSDVVANEASKWGTSGIFVDVMADEDSEVRLKGVIVMGNWWCALQDCFWKFQMDDRTLEAATDSSRVVRSAVMEFISKEILPLESLEHGRTAAFVSRVRSLDIDRLRNSADPDLVYGDGFELDFDGEGRQVGYVDENGVEEEDVVCLGCYDC